jgi:catechol 2,3-dioxygenase-like lactoylglutathione lyase family enzyme
MRLGFLEGSEPLFEPLFTEPVGIGVNKTADPEGCRGQRRLNKIPAPKENAMAENTTPATCGVDHVGLSVRDLESSRHFFCDCLGWRVVGERPEYPAAFVSDGHQIVTLWRVAAPDRAVAFDRRTNIGLHHLALAVADRAGLDSLYERVAIWPGVVVEFAPELSGKGPKIHFIVREPSGIRIEFAFDPRVKRPR